MCKENLLTIVVGTYKNGAYLMETLQSILEQDYSRIELIVVEDGDPDFDRVVVEEYIEKNKKQNLELFTILSDGIHRGTVKSINRVIDYVHGTYIKLIAGDDVYPNSKIFSMQVEYFKEHNECDLVVGNTEECDCNLNRLYEVGFRPCNALELLHGSKKRLLRSLYRDNLGILPVQCSCYRVTLLEELGWFDDRFVLVEDAPLIHKIVESSVAIGYIDSVSVCHRGGVGVSSSFELFDVRRLDYYRDLRTFFEKYLLPRRWEIGFAYIYTRYLVTCFRVEYAEGNSNKMWLIAKYFFPLCGYCCFKIDRVWKFMCWNLKRVISRI